MSENDPDETEGRKLYRARADAYAGAQINYGRRGVKLTKNSSDVVKLELSTDQFLDLEKYFRPEK